MLREIVLDTETTGLDAAGGDRLIEVGCVEIVNRIPTGREFHRYLNPDRDIHPEAVAVHGLTREFLQDKPCFEVIADEFLEFIGDAPLVAHNAAFDFGFLNAELERAARPPLTADRIEDAECPPDSELTYQNFGEEFMAQNCQRCHASDADSRHGAPSTIHFDTLEEVRMRRTRIFLRAAAGNTSMPPGPDDPPDEERDLLAEWLACGAP